MENSRIKQNPKRKAPLRVSQERKEKAVDSLLKWVKSRTKNRNPHEDEYLYMVVTLKKEITRNANPSRIPIPHPLFPLDGSQDICLIINDKVKRMNVEVAMRKIKDEGLPISRVLKFSKLRTDYQSSDSKKELFDSFDMFMVDISVLPLLSKGLRKGFFKKKQQPIPVELGHKQWRGELEMACSSVFAHIGKGNSYVVKVARVSQTRQQILENVGGVIEGLPSARKNIRALHLKSAESLALPLFQYDVGFGSEGGKKGLQVLNEKKEAQC